MLVMDVGSTKCDVIDAARRGLREQVGSFVPAHPIAGKEVAGVEHAEADAVRRPPGDPDAARPPTPELCSAPPMSGRRSAPSAEDAPEEHDTAFAAVSHLPHLLAFAFFKRLPSSPQQRLPGAGRPGLSRLHPHRRRRPAVWRDILLANREEVLAQSQALSRTTLDAARSLMRRRCARRWKRASPGSKSAPHWSRCGAARLAAPRQ